MHIPIDIQFNFSFQVMGQYIKTKKQSKHRNQNIFQKKYRQQQQGFNSSRRSVEEKASDNSPLQQQQQQQQQLEQQWQLQQSQQQQLQLQYEINEALDLSTVELDAQAQIQKEKNKDGDAKQDLDGENDDDNDDDDQESFSKQESTKYKTRTKKKLSAIPHHDHQDNHNNQNQCKAYFLIIILIILIILLSAAAVYVVFNISINHDGKQKQKQNGSTSVIQNSQKRQKSKTLAKQKSLNLNPNPIPNPKSSISTSLSLQDKQLKWSQNQTNNKVLTNKKKQSMIEIQKISETKNELKTISAQTITQKFKGVFGKSPKVSIKQKIVYQNGTQAIVSVLVQNQQNINKNSSFNHQDRIIPFYMWQGDKQIPDRYKQMMSSLQSYIFIQNCGVLVKRIQDMLKKQFSPVIKNKSTINKMNDLCKIIYLYEYAGLYSDLDTKVDYQCVNQYLKGKQNHFEATDKGGQDLFFIYFRRPKNHQLFKALQKWDYYHVYSSLKRYATAFLLQVKSKKVSHSGCVKHFRQNTYISKTQVIQKQKQKQAQTQTKIPKQDLNIPQNPPAK